MPIEWAGERLIIDRLNQRIGGMAICCCVHSMRLKNDEVYDIYNHFNSVANKTIDKRKKLWYNSCVEEGINSFRVVE